MLSAVVEHTEHARVAFIDTDIGGRIHFTAVFRWAEAAETGLYRKLGLIRENRGAFPRRHVEADYLRVLTFEDQVEIRLRVDAIGRTSVGFVWDILHDGEVAVTGRHTIVQVDDDGRPLPLDEQTRALLSGDEYQET